MPFPVSRHLKLREHRENLVEGPLIGISHSHHDVFSLHASIGTCIDAMGLFSGVWSALERGVCGCSDCDDEDFIDAIDKVRELLLGFPLGRHHLHPT
jgi:hypothetical protein